MQSRFLLVAVGVLVVGLAVWFTLSGTSNAKTSETIVLDVGRPDVKPVAEADELAGIGADLDAGSGGREAVAATLAVGDEDMGEHPWADMLAGLTGRIVEKTGEPVVGIRVELIEADLSLLYSAEHAALGNEDMEVGDVVTDADGRFLFKGARDGAFHALNIDRGGGRATIRLVEQSVEMAALTDIGDIVMDEFGTLIGTVIDEDGEPVGGARVRATILPEIVMQTGVLDARPGVVITAKDSEEFVIEAPPSAFALLDRLPVPTTTTLSDGSFRLEGVPLGSVSGGVDMPGHVAAVIGPVEMTATEVDVGELELLFGRTISGTVTDQLGEPVAGVNVVTGAFHPLFKVAIMQPGGVTDEAGRYQMQAIPESGEMVAAIQRHRSEGWTLGKVDGNPNQVDFVLEAAGRIIATVVDEAGDPVEDAVVTVRAALEPNDQMAWLETAMSIGRKPFDQTKARKTATPGVYTVEDMRLGKWMVHADAPGRAVIRKEVEHKGGETKIELVVPKGRSLMVTVVDEVTGLPINKAHATLLGPEGFMMTAFASGFTKPDGTAELGPLSPEWHEESSKTAVWLKDIAVSVEHPLYGMGRAKVTADDVAVQVALPPRCTVQGTVTWGGGPPGNIYMVLLRWEDEDDPMAQMTMLPRTAITNLEGRFKVTGLAPGNYKVDLVERYFDGNPIQLIIDQKEPKRIAEEDVAVSGEAPAEVSFELSPDGMGPSGRFGGRVTKDGAGVSGVEVKIGRADPDILLTDSGGYFESEPYPVINTQRITINMDMPLPDGSTESRQVFREWKRPKRDEVTEIEVNLTFTPVTVRVIDGLSKAPIADVDVSLSAGGGWRGRRGRNKLKTNSQGEAETTLPDDRTYTVTATREGYAQGSAKTTGAQVLESDGVLTIELVPEVPCAGIVVLPEGTAEPGRMWMNVTAPGFEGDWSEIDSETMAFELKKMSPGEFEAQVWSGPGNGMVKAKFEVPEGGDVNMVIEFAKETD